MEHTTEWRLKLNEVVLGPLKKIQEFAGGAQRKIASLATATSDFAKQQSTSSKIAQNSYIGLQEQLRKLESLQQRAWDTKHIQNYQKAINKVKADMQAWEAKKVLPSSAPKQNWFQRAKGQFSEGLSQINLPGGNNIMGMLQNPAVIYGAVALAAGSFIKQSTEAAVNWEYGMKKINATAQLPLPTLDKLDERLTQIGSKSGGNFARVPESYEKILSVTGKVNLSLDILQVAIQGAKAGFTDLDIVGRALAQTMAVVGSQNTTAQEVMDTLLKAKAMGAGEFTDFAQYLPQLTAAGRNLSASFQETAGLFAFMTFKGQSAADSAMLMQNAFTALQKTDLIKGLKNKGIALFNADGSRRAIGEVFVELSSKLSQLSDFQKTKFFADIGLNDAQARNAFSVLTSDAARLKEILGGVNNAIGETNKQLAATENYKTSWAEMGDQMDAAGKNFGNLLLPLLQVFVRATKELSMIFSSEFWTKDYWVGGNPAEVEAKLLQQDQNQSRLIAAGAVRKKYNLSPDENFTREQWGDYLKAYNKSMAAYKELRNPNRIVAGEKDAGVVDSSGKTTDSLSAGDTGDTAGGSRSPKTLIMNLDIKNYFQKGDEKVKNKHTDDIVDAARDALVVVGGNN